MLSVIIKLLMWVFAVIVVVSVGVLVYNSLTEPVRGIVAYVLVITAPAAGVFAILHD